MKVHRLVELSVIVILCFSCKNKTNDNLSGNATDFVPTLESEITNSKNYIYCATILLAKDHLGKVLNSEITTDSNNKDLERIINSSSFIGTLNKSEYNVSSDVEGDNINIKTDFKKALPFKRDFKSFSHVLNFKNTQVSSFGTFGYDLSIFDFDIDTTLMILYYKNDNDFILKLTPKNAGNEIILFKTLEKYNTMTKILNKIDQNIKIGRYESLNKKLNWKFYINDEDTIVIPKISFDMTKDFNELIGEKIQTNKQSYFIGQFSQRIAFELNEKGASLESSAEIDVSAAEEERPKPRNMKFDNNFFLMIKKTNQKNPYLGMWITNSDLMEKE